jgi:hypothetical protein
VVARGGPGADPVVIDLDSTVCEVHGKAKEGAAYGYTRVLGYHPPLATWAASGEVLHAQLRKGSAQRGAKRFIEELVARVRRAGVKGPLVIRGEPAFVPTPKITTAARPSAAAGCAAVWVAPGRNPLRRTWSKRIDHAAKQHCP